MAAVKGRLSRMVTPYKYCLLAELDTKSCHKFIALHDFRKLAVRVECCYFLE